MKYFDKVFAAVARMRPRPVVNLFGGEPTVRDDMFEIIELGRTHGVDTQITTNGLRLADENYCRKLCEANVGLRLSFDGRQREIYERLRNNGGVLDKKMKALANLKKYSRRKHTIIACAATGHQRSLHGRPDPIVPREPRVDLRLGDHPLVRELGAGHV